MDHDLNNNIIISEDYSKFDIGFIPNGKLLFAKCPDCGYLQQFELGQGTIFQNDTCPNCNSDECAYYTEEIFENIRIYFIYSDCKYKISELRDFNGDTKLVKDVSKYLGETYFDEPWDLNDNKLYDVDYFIKFKLSSDECILINKEDIDILLYFKYKNTNLNSIYYIDEHNKVCKLSKIDVSVSIS